MSKKEVIGKIAKVVLRSLASSYAFINANGWDDYFSIPEINEAKEYRVQLQPILQCDGDAFPQHALRNRVELAVGDGAGDSRWSIAPAAKATTATANMWWGAINAPAATRDDKLDQSPTAENISSMTALDS